MSTLPDLGKYVPLRMIVALALDELDKSEGSQDMCWQLGLRALVKINQQVAAEPLTVRIPVLSNKTVPMPADCITWTKIGVLNSKGEVNTLRINNALTTFRDNNPNRLTDLTADITEAASNLTNAPFYLNYYYNDGYYNLFGTQTGLIQYGQCRVDENKNLVILNEDFRYDSIIFEYISMPKVNNDYRVLLSFQEAIIAFIKWKLNKGTRQEFYAEVTEGRRTLNGKKVTLQAVNQVIRESEGMKLRS